MPTTAPTHRGGADRAPAIRVRSVSGEVGAYLLRLLETGLGPGDRLPTERELVERLGVSRTSVREALRDLEAAGVVERAPGRGTTVAVPPESVRTLVAARFPEPDEEGGDVRDAAELRLIVEPAVAGLAAERATEADELVLERTLADSHAGLTPAESLALDVRFHVQLARAARNPLLLTLCETATTLVAEVRARSHETRAGRRVSVGGHRAIYEAVVARDPERARRAMVEHLSEVDTLATGRQGR